MKITFVFFLKCLLLSGLLTGLAACQGVNEVPGENDMNESPVPVESQTRQVEGEMKTGLTGMIFAESDVSGQSDQPLSDQMIVAIPIERASAVLGAGRENSTDAELRFLKASLATQDPAVTVTLSDAEGMYDLRVEPGAYILCVADSDSEPPGFPATTRGCGRIQAAAGEVRRVDISSGFGEILLLER